jgi:membrane fusion protein (multidrug efflux system)
MKAYYKLLFSFIVLGSLLPSCKEEEKTIPPAEVGVIKPIQKQVPVITEFVGEIKGMFDIPIRARVDGFLEEVAFQEGTLVEKGQLLYVIDNQPFLAQVASAKSELAAAKTDLVHAKNELKRIRPLAEMNAVSQSDLDAAIANEGAAEAMVDAAKAKVEISQINLSYCRIHSPIRGTIGKTEADMGEYVGKAPNPVILNTVSRTDTIQLDFFLSENEYLMLARLSMKKHITEDHGKDDENNKLELVLSDGTVHPYEGKFDFIDRNVNSETGSILIQASFPNNKKMIRPGQYGRLRNTFMTKDKSIIIPQKCVIETQGKFSVYIVSGEKKIELKTIKVFGKYQDYYIVSEGLSGNEDIVLEGMQKVRPGTVVSPIETEFKSRLNKSK